VGEDHDAFHLTASVAKRLHHAAQENAPRFIVGRSRQHDGQFFGDDRPSFPVRLLDELQEGEGFSIQKRLVQRFADELPVTGEPLKKRVRQLVPQVVPSQDGDGRRRLREEGLQVVAIDLGERLGHDLDLDLSKVSLLLDLAFEIHLKLSRQSHATVKAYAESVALSA
jgi:hypothetical protein